MFQKHKQSVIAKIPVLARTIPVIPDRFASELVEGRNLIRNLWNTLSLRGGRLWRPVPAKAGKQSHCVHCHPERLKACLPVRQGAKDLSKIHLLRFFIQRFFASLRMTESLRMTIRPAKVIPILALFLLIIPEIASAQSMDTMGPWLKDAQHTITAVMLYINRILWVVLVIVGPLLDNNMLFSSCVEGTGTGADFVCNKTMEDNLLGIWVQIRNIVNIIFVVILVFTALYNVIGKTEGEFVLKTMLPKIIIGLIAVNFSFLISKVVLDAANVATTAVAAIPVNVNPELQDFKAFKSSLGTKLCNYTNDTGQAPTPLTDAQIEEWGLRGICTSGGTFEDAFNTNFLDKFTHTNLAFIMTVEIANLSKFKFVSNKLSQSGDWAVLDTVLDFLLDFAVNLGIMVLYAVAVLALLAVAAMRIVVLWLMIALSPLVVLVIIIPQLGKGLGDTDLKSAFVQHAIAPIIMVGALSIGFVLLESMTNDISMGGESFALSDKSLNDAVGAVSKGNFEGMHLGDLLALIGGVMVIWTGVFGAASKTYANFITDKISDFTKKGAIFLAKLPLYATPVPITKTAEAGGGHKNIPLAHMLAGTKNLWQDMGEKLGGRAAAKKSFEGTGFEKFFGEDKDAAIDEFKKSKNYTDVKRTLPAMVEFDLDKDAWEQRAKEIEGIAKTDTENAPTLKQIAEAIRESDGDEDTIIEKIKAFDPGLATAMETAKGKAAEKRAGEEKAKTDVPEGPKTFEQLSSSVQTIIVQQEKDHNLQSNPDFRAAAVAVANNPDIDVTGFEKFKDNQKAQEALQAIAAAAKTEAAKTQTSPKPEETAGNSASGGVETGG